MNLDTAVANSRFVFGQHHAWRLDARGQRIVKDGEGFDLLDTWAADSTSDQIIIATGNGLYGAIMVLRLPDAPNGNEMRGHGQEYGDVMPEPKVPIVPVVATRVACAELK